MLASEPADTFLRYSLALEMQKEARHDESLKLLSDLIQNDPPYVPAFFMAGQQLSGLRRVAEAREIIRSGIEEARRQDDHHAAAEMSEFLTALGSLGE